MVEQGESKPSASAAAPPLIRREKPRPAPILDQTVPIGMPPVPLQRADVEGDEGKTRAEAGTVEKAPELGSQQGSESDLSEGDLSLLGGEVGGIPALGATPNGGPVAVMGRGMTPARSADALATSAVSTASSSEIRVGLPAATAQPSQCRKSPLQFRTLLMLLFLVRSIAAAARRIMRDMTLVSSERFFNIKFVERHRFQLHNAINVCWFIASTIDLILSTARLCQKGWFQYAAYRQNVHCRCACKRFEDPADFICRNHGFVTRRKTDLFFPPLDMDYGAPVTSNIGFFEAANPATMKPSCARCGCIYDVPVQRVYASENPAHHNPSTEIARRSTSNSNSTPLPMMGQRGSSLVVSDSRGEMNAETRVVQPRVSTHRRRATPTSLGMMSAGVGSTDNSLNGSPIASPVTRQFQRFEGLFSLKEQARSAAVALSNKTATPSPAVVTSPAAVPPRLSRHPSGADLTTDDVEATAVRRPARRDDEDVGLLLVPWVMRRLFNYAWLVMVHENFTSTLLMQLRYMAEWYLAFQYTFGTFECHVRDAPLNKVLHLDGAIAGLVAALVVLTRVIQSAPR